VIPSVSIKDRSLLVPLVILNACLTFSWSNKVPFDREASDMIWAGTYTGARTGAEGSMTGDTKSEPKVRPGSRAVPGYYSPSLSHDVYQNLVIGDL
jgi:hypothetical protein